MSRHLVIVRRKNYLSAGKTSGRSLCYDFFFLYKKFDFELKGFVNKRLNNLKIFALCVKAC